MLYLAITVKNNQREEQSDAWSSAPTIITRVLIKACLTKITGVEGMEGDRERLTEGKRERGKEKEPGRKEGRIVRGRQTDPAAGFLGWSHPSADADAAAALMLKSLSQTTWRRAGSRMSGGAYQILSEISKSRSKRKALIPIVALFKAECPVHALFFPLHGWGQSTESSGYFQILNRDYAEIHFIELLKTCLIR